MRSNPKKLRTFVTAGALTLAGCAHTDASKQEASVPAPAPAPTAEAAPAAHALALGVATQFMDKAVRPQDDFFRYVNGTWLKTTTIPADKARYGSFIELRDKSEAALKEIIEEAAAKKSEPGTEPQKVGDLYRAFMDTDTVEKLGATPVQPELDRVKSLKDKSELPVLFAELQRSGIETPFAFYVWQDAKHADRYISYVAQSGLGLPDRDYYFKTEPRFVEVRAAYEAYVARLLELGGRKPADAKAAAKRIITFETALAEKQWDRAKNRDRELTYNLKTIAELDTAVPGFAFTRFLEKAGATSTPGVIVRQPDYLAAMGALLQSTPLPTLKEYLSFKVLDSAAPYLSSPFVQAHFEFHGKTLEGQQEIRPRWKRAVSAVDSSLGEVVGKLYVERHFKPESKARMKQLVENLRAAFRAGIDHLDWMSPETRAQAQQKLAKFNVKIGYPDKWRDYSKLQIQPGVLLPNIRSAAAFEFQRDVDRLGKPIDRTEWGMTPQTVNAYYSSTMNEIVFPAAILQPPFFNPEADDATNYGAIGGVIGHEISHGFDDQGARSDGDGNLRNWWTESDKKAFDARTAMLADQYNAFSPVEGMHVNGKLTLGENIGDLSGLTVAYRAWQISLGGRKAPEIDGFTGPQRFFLGWAQVWRGLQRDDYARQALLTDPHSPGEFRVNGVVRNMPEFYEAFGVKERDGTWLPPEKRVKIW